jgi:hypothetical protein
MPVCLNLMNNGNKTPSLRDFRFSAIIQDTKTMCLRHFMGKAGGPATHNPVEALRYEQHK